jgi:hypothetical protein
MDERARRIGKNEALFREVNERIEEIAGGPRIEFLCECGNVDCTEPVTLTAGEYEALRAEPDRFAVLPGHEEPDVEDVVERHDGYLVVRKHPGGPAELAEARDPRS